MQNNNLDRLYIGNRSGGRNRAYVKFATMPTIPSGATISSATMTLYITSGASTGYSITAYKILADWDSSTIKWSNRPSASTLVASNIGHNNLTKYSFSCTSAVQSWYSGSTTGSNANYGIMLRYYDETVADYNAVYSADYSTESKRPSITITYQTSYASIEVDVGTYYTLTPPSTSGTITWASNDTAIATVTSAGVVRGIKAGFTTVTASVGGAVQKTYMIYVTIANGVRFIKYGTLYLTVDGGMLEGSTLTLQSLKTSDVARLRQLWRIEHVTQNYYTIRSVYRSDLALNVTNGVADMASISTTIPSSAAPADRRWKITQDSSGYLLQHVGSYSKTMYPQGASPGTAVVAGVATTNWSFESATVTNRLLLINTTNGLPSTGAVRYIAPGESFSPDDLHFMVSYVNTTSNISYADWESSTPAAATIDEDTGYVTGIWDGQSTITATHPNSTYSVSYTLIVQISFTFYGVTNERHNHLTCLEIVEGLTEYALPKSDITLRTGAISSHTCKSDLMSTSIFTSRSHGTFGLDASNVIVATGILLDDNDENSSIFWDTPYDGINEAITVTDSYNNLKLAVFIGCNTGLGGENYHNLATAIVQQGATVAIGFEEEIDCDTANTWTIKFYIGLLGGRTIEDAVTVACEDLGTPTNGVIKDWIVIAGDESLTLRQLFS